MYDDPITWFNNSLLENCQNQQKALASSQQFRLILCRIYASKFNYTVFLFLGQLDLYSDDDDDDDEFLHVWIDDVLLRCCRFYTICILLGGS